MVGLSGGVLETGPDIFIGEVWKIFEDLRDRHSSCEHAEHVSYSNPGAPHDRTTVGDLGVDGNPIETSHISMVTHVRLSVP